MVFWENIVWKSSLIDYFICMIVKIIKNTKRSNKFEKVLKSDIIFIIISLFNTFMGVSKKKLFPKLKKKLRSFLTDESGKITKKDALGLAAWGAFLAMADTVSSHIPSESPPSCTGHTNHSNVVQSGSACWHANQPAISGYAAWWHLSGYNRWAAFSQTSVSWYNLGSTVSWTRTAHSSWIVNWHSSSVPNGGHISGYNRGTAFSQPAISWHVRWTTITGNHRGALISQPAVNKPLHCSHTSTIVTHEHYPSTTWKDC